MRGRTISLPITVAALAVGLAACGGGSSSPSGNGGNAANGVAGQSASQIVNTATKAMRSVSSVRVTGSLSQGASTASLDITLVANKGATGTMAEHGENFKVLVVGKRAFINGDVSLWQKAGAGKVSPALAGKWIKGSEFGSLAGDLTISSLLKSLVSGHGGLVKGAPSMIGGHKVIAVHDPSQGGTLYVATTGKPYAIELVGSKTNGTVKFGAFNAPVTLTAPAQSFTTQQIASQFAK